MLLASPASEPTSILTSSKPIGVLILAARGPTLSNRSSLSVSIRIDFCFFRVSLSEDAWTLMEPRRPEISVSS